MQETGTFPLKETQMVKGVAILFMVFAHLFNNMHLCSLCHPLLYIAGEPVVHYMIFGMNPVDFFIFLSGYGLYITYRKGRKNNIRRVVKLYIHYWLTLLIFVPLGFFIVRESSYPGSFVNIISNVLGWRNTYNHETWFLLPYVLLALSCKYLFKVTDKLNAKGVFIVTFSIYVLLRVASRVDEALIGTYRLLYWIAEYFTLLFPFMLGMLSARCWNYKKYKSLSGGGKWLLVSSLVLLFVVIILLRYHYQSIFYPFYSALFILAFTLLKKPHWIEKLLMEMGKRSTSIWFIHTYFCYYLFQEFIYGFKYPLVIFIVLLIISYFCAVVIDGIKQFVEAKI